MRSTSVPRRTATGLLACLLTLGVLVSGLAGCNNTGETTNTTPKLTGSITVAGSTSVQPVSELLAEAFTALNPAAEVKVQGGGSSTGIKAADQGAAAVGASSRNLKTSEKFLTPFIIGIDGIAVIVNPNCPVSDLTLDQIRGVFSGETSNWQQLGGPNGAIVVVNREEGSGTRGAFEEIVMGDTPVSDQAIVQSSTGAVRTTVSGDPNAVGYISLAAVSAEVKALKVDGVDATVPNIESGAYPVARPFIYVTKNAPTGVAAAFINFAFSPQGQDIIEEAGLIRVR